MANIKIRSITADPRWLQLAIRFRRDWVAAAKVLFDVDITHHQYELLSASQQNGCRVSVSSGHGTGKSSIIAIVVLLFMLFFIDARVVLIANKLDQVKIGVFKNLRVYFKILIKRYPWIDDYFTLTDTVFYENSSKGVWELSAKAYKQGQEESLAGEHADNYMIICDESSSISDRAFGIIRGGLTQDNNNLILLSQPTRDNGFFWETHNNPNYEKDWTRLTFNSEESPIVTSKFILEKFREYGCNRNNPEYMIKVRGLFSKNLAGFILSMDECLRATLLNIKFKKNEEWGWVLACDVGNGRDSSVINIAKVSGYRENRKVKPFKVIEYEGNIDPLNFGRMIINEVRNGNYPNCTVVIDCDGVGSTTAVAVEEEGIAVQRLRWGFPCFSDADKLRFQDIRALCTIEAANAIKNGRMGLDNNSKTREQASKIPYKIDHRGRYVIEKKTVMKDKYHLKSPDRFDTCCFFMIAEITPANAIIDIHTQQERQDAGHWVATVTSAS